MPVKSRKGSTLAQLQGERGNGKKHQTTQVSPDTQTTQSVSIALAANKQNLSFKIEMNHQNSLVQLSF